MGIQPGASEYIKSTGYYPVGGASNMELAADITTPGWDGGPLCISLRLWIWAVVLS